MHRYCVGSRIKPNLLRHCRRRDGRELLELLDALIALIALIAGGSKPAFSTQCGPPWNLVHQVNLDPWK